MNHLKRTVFLSLILCGALIQSPSFAQYPAWENITSGWEVNALALEDTIGWIGTSGGLVRGDTTNGNPNIYYTKNNSGLPSLDIRAVGVDVNGDKWIGTYGGGVVHFDGANWTVYNTANNSGLLSDLITCITFEGNGRPVVGSDGGGFAIWDGAIWNHFDTQNSALPNDRVTALAFNNGSAALWAGTPSGVFESNPAAPGAGTVHTTNENLPSNDITSVAIDTSGNVWVGTGGGAAENAGGTWISYTTAFGNIPNDRIQCLTVDHNNVVWAGTMTGGLLEYVGSGTWNEYREDNSGIPNNWVLSVLTDTTGARWVGTTEGLAKFDQSGWDTTIETSNSGLSWNNVQHLAPFPNQNMWFMTRNRGGENKLVYTADNGWVTYNEQNTPLQPGSFITEMKSSGNNLYIATGDTGFIHHDGMTTWTNYHMGNTTLPDNNLNDMDIDRDGRVWFASGNGIAWYNGQDIPTMTRINTQNSGLPNDFIRFIAARDTSDFWAGSEGTYRAILYHYSGRTWTTYDSTNSALPNAFVLDMELDQNGNPWIATEDGVAHFNGTTWQGFNASNSVMPDNAANSIFTEPGNVWISINNQGIPYGVVRFTAADSTLFTMDNSGLPTNHVREISRDTQGNRWFSTTQGAAKFTGGGQQAPDLQLSTTTVVFDTIHVDSTDTFDLTITNAGNDNLNLNDMHFFGPDTANYNILTDYTSPMVPAAQQIITLQFDPVSAGTKPAGLVILSNAPSSPDTVAISGTAQAVAADLSVVPRTIDYGAIHRDSTAIRTVFLTNNGNSDLVMRDLYLTGPDTSEFDILSVLATPLAAGAQQGIQVAFDPNTEGQFSAFMVVSSLAPTSPDSVSLGGIAGLPGLSMDKTGMAFGLIPPGSSALDTVVMGNTGAANLTFTSLPVKTGADTADFQIMALPENPMAPGSAGNVIVRFTPVGTGNKSAWIVFNHDAPGSPDSIRVTGSSGAPGLSVDNPSINFGQTTIGSNASRTLTITNSGTSDLIIDNQTLGGPDAALFTLSSASASPNSLELSATGLGPDRITLARMQAEPPLAPGATRELSIQFTPTSTGQKTAFLQIISNASTSPDTVALTGEGLPRSQAAVLELSTQLLAFGEVTAGVTRTSNVLLRNTGQAQLNVTGIRLGGSNTDVFTVSPTTAQTILTDSTVSLRVQFTPLQQANYEAFIIIESSSESSPDSVRLTGSGTQTLLPAIRINPYTMQFGTLNTGESASLSSWISNPGAAVLLIQDVRMVQLHGDVYSVTTALPSQIDPGDSARLTITFSPATDTTYPAACKITTNAASSPDSIYISGSGEQVTFNLTNPTPPVSGQDQDYSLSFTIDPPIPGITVWVFYTQSGSAVWDSIQCAVDGNSYNAIIPDAILQLRGLSYYMEVVDLNGEILFANGSQDNPAAFLPVTIKEEKAPVVPEKMVYTMFSVPANLERGQIIDVLRDDLGAYGPKAWRLFFWDQTANRYDEYGRILDRNLEFRPGVAYWLITRISHTIDIENGSSTEALAPFEITFQPGWNQFGHPFAFRVDWNLVENKDALSILIGRTRDEYTYGTRYLIPWNGYFVYNFSDTNVTVRIPAIEAAATPAAKTLKNPAMDGFVFQFEIRGQNPDWVDTQNFMGMKAGAKDGPDQSDYPEAPPVDENGRLSILEQGTPFAGSFKAINENGALWDMSLTSPGKQEIVKLDLHRSGILPEGFDVWLLDKERECLIPLNDGSGEIEIQGNHVEQFLRLIVGKKTFAESNNDNIPLVAYGFDLKQNYPNPFNPETQIVYSLAEKSHVRLTIYNVRGQEVSRLIDRVQTTGRHSVTWNGRDHFGAALPSGMYIVRIGTEHFNKTRKMILVR